MATSEYSIYLMLWAEELDRQSKRQRMVESREPELKPSAKIPGVTPVDALKVGVWWPICILYVCVDVSLRVCLCMTICILHLAIALRCDFVSSRDSPLFFRGRLSE
jgi:hypothetical protein